MARIQCRHRRLVRWYSPLPTLGLLGGGAAALRDWRRGPRYVSLALLAPLLLVVQYVAYGVGLAEGLVVSCRQ